MAMTKPEKKKIIETHRLEEKDSGSPEVQVAILTKRINDLTGHFQTHQKDFHSRRGLLMLVSRRKKLLDYLKTSSRDRYNKIVTDLGLRK